MSSSSSGTTLRIERASTHGIVGVGREYPGVQTNVWVIGNEEECVVVDAPADVVAILNVVADRTVKAILATHAHHNHTGVAPALSWAVGAPIHLHREEEPTWARIHPHDNWDCDLVDNQRIAVAGIHLEVLHTPGLGPGAVSFYAPALGAVFTGDTLGQKSLGVAGAREGKRNKPMRSSNSKLLSLPNHTVVHPGHGRRTTIGAEFRATVLADSLANSQRRYAGPPVPFGTRHWPPGRTRRWPGDEAVP